MTALELEQSAEPRGVSRVRSLLRRRPLLPAAVACLVSFAAFWVVQRLAGVTMIDLMVYRAEGWTARNGEPLYDMVATSAHLPNTYPPFAALLFTPLTLFDVPLMRTLATAGNLVLLLAVVHLSLRLVGRPRRIPHWAATFALSALLVWCEPVWTTLRYGQINLFIAVLVLWDLTRKDTNRWAGVGIGIAAGIKLTPALFAVFLAVAGLVRAVQRLRTRPGARAADRTAGTPAAGPESPHRPAATAGRAPGGTPPLRARLRAAWNPWLRQSLVATVTFLATALLPALALPDDARRFWTEIVFAADRVGDVWITANQSLRGALARLLHAPDPGAAWLVAALVVTVAGMAIAVAALLRGLRAWAVVACAATALLISPISWSHHWVWGVPMLIVLGAEALRRGGPGSLAEGAAGPGGGRRWWALTAGIALLFCSYALWWVPHRWHQREELAQNAGQMLLSGVYPIAGLAFLALAALQVRRAAGTSYEAPATAPRTGA
ncbi:glycosyltransferase 87 family protein [Streptomyces sp. NPDC003077]|uniref:glycosyltransferase 87 family protein n=1 Tax=Streptomyces sp. NPDC003077 TaxID=3154443 RepID=UPI0033B85FF5